MYLVDKVREKNVTSYFPPPHDDDDDDDDGGGDDKKRDATPANS
jgi:hypothetical protein